jgi:hypothetical protein
MSEEILRVLKMVEEGKIDADKGAMLIEAINNKKEKKKVQIEKASIEESLEKSVEEVKLDKELVFLKEDKQEEKNFKGEKMLKVRVLSSDGDKVNITLPIKFVKGVIQACGKIPNINVDNVEGVNPKEMTDTILAAIDGGMEGKIIDIKSGDGDIVEVTIE